jgi:pimeloyl-ACP methyl ester carboxylesterase
MSVYVLVHGGFYGGWGWAQVARLLRAAGHEVYTPTMTGYGERSHLASPDINLNTHIQDIALVLECEDLNQVILVGHSYGTMAITGVAELMPERLSRLVYIDTVIPKDGQSFFDLVGTALSEPWLNFAREKGDGWRGPALPNPPNAPPRWMPALIKPLIEPIEIKNPAAAKIPHGFILCTARDVKSPIAGSYPALDRATEEAKQQGWWYRELNAIHGVMLSNPKLLTEVLLELA